MEDKAAKMNPTTLTYFPAHARAFAIRAALRYAKFEYVDNRIVSKVFGEQYKHDPTKVPLGVLPVLEMQDGRVFGKFYM